MNNVSKNQGVKRDFAPAETFLTSATDSEVDHVAKRALVDQLPGNNCALISQSTAIELSKEPTQGEKRVVSAIASPELNGSKSDGDIPVVKRRALDLELNRSIFQFFPPDLLSKITGCTDRETRRSLKLCCKRFHRILTESLIKKVNSGLPLEVLGCYQIEHLTAFFNLHGTRIRTLNGRFIPIQGLTKLTALIKLYLSYISLSEILYYNISGQLFGLSSLKKLKLEFCGYKGVEGFVSLSKVTSLTKLSLIFDSMTDLQGSNLSQLTALKELAILRDTYKDRSFSHLSNLTSLKKLKLVNSANITDSMIQNLVNLNSLVVLNLRDSHITDDGLTNLCKLVFLKGLFLSQCSEITDRGLVNLSNLTDLKVLDIAGVAQTQITGAGVLHLSHLSSLEFLKIGSHNSFTDHDLLNLPKLKSLKILDLTWCTELTNEGLIYFVQMSALELIRVSLFSQITRDRIKELSGHINVDMDQPFDEINITDARLHNFFKKYLF
jgi:hypothetical protein